MIGCLKEAHRMSLYDKNNCYCKEEDIKNLDIIKNRPSIILIGKTTENFVKLIKEIKNGN